MLNQERKMQVAIGVGILVLILAAMFVSSGERTLKRDDYMGGDAVSGENGPGNANAAPGTNDSTAEAPIPRTVTYAMRAQSKTGQAGTVTLTDLGHNRTSVVVILGASGKADTQPANIHAGTCKDAAKEPQYALNPVVKGRSQTVLSVSIGALVDKAPQSLRVRTDAVTPNLPYSSCGDLK